MSILFNDPVDYFLRRLVLRRWPTYANTQKPTKSPSPWPPPTPRMNAFQRSYGHHITPTERVNHPYFKNIHCFFPFGWFSFDSPHSLLHKYQRYCADHGRRRHPYGALSMELLPRYCAHISFSTSIFTILCWIFQIWTISWMEALYRSFLISRISYQRTM